MSSTERPIGAAKGKPSDTEALCQTHPQKGDSGGGPGGGSYCSGKQAIAMVFPSLAYCLSGSKVVLIFSTLHANPQLVLIFVSGGRRVLVWARF